ncbi:MAG: amidase family protein [Nitriliruptor sp.]
MSTPTAGSSATDIAEAVRSGRARAVDVARAHLDQLAEVEHRLGAYVTVLQREAMAAAEAVDAREDRSRLPMAGVPVAIKDVAAVAGQPTRHGSRATSPDPATTDDDVVARWRAAGAVIIGITRCPELSLWGTSDDPAGVAVSPWQPTRTAGGSSGGSGAAVAAGTVPLALASDGLGSVRIPAGCCGLVGIKPGEGLAPALEPDGSHHWFGMSRYGPVATTVADAALGLATLAGRPDLATIRRHDRPLRVAVSWAAPAPGIVVARPWIDATIQAAQVLRRDGHHISHHDPPYEPATILAAMLRWTQGAAHDVEALAEDPAALQPRTVAHARIGRWLARRMPVDDAQARRWRTRVDPFLERYDVLITPMFARTQPRADTWHRRGWLSNVVANLSAYPFAAAWNLADVPAASVPMGSHGGRPLAVQVVGRRGSEAAVLAVAAELERLAPWTRHPPAWGLAD